MARRDATGAWIPLMDYAMKNGVSLSTLRRHIKSKKVSFQIEGGRYLLWDENASPDAAAVPTSAQPLVPAPNSDKANTLQATVFELKSHLKKAQEEIAELKMLVALYEERNPKLDV